MKAMSENLAFPIYRHLSRGLAPRKRATTAAVDRIKTDPAPSADINRLTIYSIAFRASPMRETIC